MTISRLSMLGLSLGVLAATATACIPGPYPNDFFQEMHYTQVQRREEPNRAAPPPDSVSTNGRPPAMSFAQAGQLSNPLPNNAATLDQGNHLAGVYCAVCHGPNGNGVSNARLAQYFNPDNPTVSVPPPAFTDDVIRGRSDGQLYWIIDHGLGNMPAFDGRLTSDQIWAVVAYVRQQAGH